MNDAANTAATKSLSPIASTMCMMLAARSVATKALRDGVDSSEVVEHCRSLIKQCPESADDIAHGFAAAFSDWNQPEYGNECVRMIAA